MPRSPSVPKYRHHKPTGQAVVTIRTAAGERRDVYLGLYNTPKSRAEYGRIVSELATRASDVQSVSLPEVGKLVLVTVDELVLAFLTHAQQYYRTPDGTPSEQSAEYKRAVTPLLAGVPAAGRTGA